MARKKVLICDDQETIRKSLGEALADDGYEIDEAGDGTTALDRVRDEAPDLLLLDLKLPDTTGVEVLRTIRDEGRDVPVILMTAYGDTPTAVEAMKLGAYDFVEKPFTTASPLPSRWMRVPGFSGAKVLRMVMGISWSMAGAMVRGWITRAPK